ncbi:MAG: urea ABC transporter permease subunit UrtB, partial [Myxococcota bacterium]
MKRIRRVWFVEATIVLLVGASAASADFDSAFQGLGSSSRNTIRASIEELAELNDGRALGALEALRDKRLHVDDAGGLFIESEVGDSFVDALSGQPAEPDPKALRTPRINNRVRRSLNPAIAQLQLYSPDRDVRFAAAESLRQRASESAAELIRSVLENEKDAGVRDALLVAVAQIDISGDDPGRRMVAVESLGRLGDRNHRSHLEALLKTNEDGSPLEADEPLRAAATKALDSIGLRAYFVDLAGNFFYGLSLASILLLAALGLAITFGLMGVINMAHGEMLMLGAYTTYVTLGLFESYLPGLLNAYILAAIPAAVVVCGCVGMLMERGVIRFLYGRPLETLLATWGISLILIQTVRLVFGAQNVEVANPAWLSGGYEIFRGVVLPWSRIFIVIFAGFTVTVVWLALQRTPLGLRIRAVTQNREMAASL